MYQLTLEWPVDKQTVSQTISDKDTTKVPGSIRIGRDAARCDVVLKHPDPSIEKTVSGLHAEIFFEPRSDRFCLRNLTRDRQSPEQPNPIVLNHEKVIQQEAPIQVGSQIKLGKMSLTVRAIEIAASARSAEPGLDQRYALKCGNVREPHFWPLNYSKLTCEICGRAILGATLIFKKE